MTYKINIGIGLLCVLACAHTPATQKASTGGPATAQEKDAVKPALQTIGLPTLGPGDIFEVRIFQEEDLSGTYRVGSDGSFNFPLVGNINIEGLTPNQSSDKIKENLKAYLVDPQVSIFIKEFNSKKVFVFGEVQRPGTFNYENQMNIIQAITLAGGFAKFADRNGTFVTRLIEGQEQRIQVSVRSIGEGKRPNFSLEPGDIVYVPQSMF
ncbi:MAG: polysaccharide biosynthesis/export family protein [Myxococcota bacterium]|jgi:polysaccharide export outer membrane protein|nr:polysaccharide biosynthesis/export family protein [Myxococcota bacterium]